MRSLSVRLAASVFILFFAACASRPLPKYEKPIARTRVQQVRTTAYTHTEDDHIQHGRKTALGTRLSSSNVKSAAADWSRWPAGTVFRIMETGEVYRVDDYGWALAGTNTIDLYKPSRSAMNAWGVKRVTIENLVWGDVDRSLAVLKGRSKYKHVRRMIDQIEDRYSQLKTPLHDPAQEIAQTQPAIPVAAAVSAPPIAPAVPIARVPASSSGARLTPFRAQ
jgi:3D (Asp-Asp-Asp) domain-containing protein